MREVERFLAVTPGPRHDQRRARGPLEQRLLHPLATLAEMVAVIAEKDDDRVVRQLQPIERVEHAPDVGVEKRDGRVVGACRLALPFFARHPNAPAS